MTAHAGRRAAHTPALFPEGVVAERFRILDVLGVGGTATVFEAVDERDGSAVALKAIPRDERLQRRARREMRVAATLDHPAIVRLLDTAEDDDYVYVVFELVRGQDLAGVLRAGELDDAAILRAVAAVCDALGHAHARGVVHRDVKPGNVLVRDDGILKLTDFGIAFVDHPDATADDRLLGTLSYMAPEQVRGRPVTGAADVWSSALMAYEALTGTNPYRARTPRDLVDLHQTHRVPLSEARPELPAPVVRVLESALELDPARRPEAERLRDALLAGARQIERGLDGTATAALRLDEPPPAARRMHRLRRRLATRPRLLPRRRPRLRLVPTPAPDTVERAVAAMAHPAVPLGPQPAPATGPVEHEDSAEHSLLGDPAAAVRRLSARLGAIEAPALPFVGALDAPTRARLVRPATGLAAAIGAIPLLGALPFYPTGWAVVLGILVGLVAVARPLLAVLLVGALALPLLGNLALGLVAPAAVVVLAWPVLAAADRRRAVLPALAPPLALLGLAPLYLLASTTSARAHVRFALGAAGALAITLAAGLAGRPLGLSDTAPGQGLSASLAGLDDPFDAVRLVLDAAGPATFGVAAAWGLLAVVGRPALQLAGPRAAWFGAVWLSMAAALTVLLPVVWGAPPAPLAPTAVGTILVAILLAFRSALVEAGGDPATSDHARSTPQDR